MSDKPKGAVRTFFATVGRVISWVRVMLANLLFVVMLLLFLGVLFGREPIEPPDGAALVVAPWGELVDELEYIDPISRLLEGQEHPLETRLADLIESIDAAAEDSRIVSLVLDLDGMSHAGLSKSEELAAALQRFKASGKPIIAKGDNYSQDQYWLASFADEVLLHPMGSVILQGYGVYRPYFREALDQLAVKFHIFRVGEYKSAVEPFTRNSMSDAAREANLHWLNDLWQLYRQQVASNRNLEVAALDRYINQLDQVMVEHEGDAAEAARANGLVDQLMTRVEMNRYLISRFGSDGEGSFNAIGSSRYLALHRSEQFEMASDSVGVVVARGMIVDGEQPPGVVGGDTLAQLIRQARENPSIKALVLRVDSEGGSAFASEVIRQELQLLKQSGKPLVVSMGSIAASGGYWIAAEADQIWATPATLTGSIGIFGLFPTIEESLSKLGIHSDGVGTTELADGFRVDRPMNPVAARTLQSTIENGYQRFLNLVSDGREMSVAEVDKIAQGRVWSGRQAQQLGLVDHLGGLQESINAAAELANLDDYRIENVTQPLSPGEMLLNSLQSSLWLTLFPESYQAVLTGLQQPLSWAAKLNDPRGVYLHCAGCVAP